MMDGASVPISMTVALVATPTVAMVALTFTTVDPLALVAALGVFVTIIGGVIVQIIREMAKRTEAAIVAVAAKVDKAVETVDDVKVIAKATEVQVNSKSSAQLAKIDGLEKQLETLRDLLADKKETAALLAQAAAKVPGPPSAVSDGTGPAKSLEQIDANTEAIKENTAKSDATIQEVKDKLT